MNPKRRWMLTVVGVMVLAVFVGVIILLSRKGAANDFGRVTVIKCTVQNGGRVVLLRLDAPRRRAMRARFVGVEEPEYDGQSVVWR